MRYRVNYKTPAGRADLAFPLKNLAIFVDGCFWHGCPTHYVRPRSRPEFWAGKLRANVYRDRRQTLALEGAGWRVLRYWEHEVFERPQMLAKAIRSACMTRIGASSPRRCWRVTYVEPLSPRRGRVEPERVVLEDLRDPAQRIEVVRPRTTRKWKVRAAPC